MRFRLGDLVSPIAPGAAVTTEQGAAPAFRVQYNLAIGTQALVTGIETNKLDQVLSYELTIYGKRYKILERLAKKYLRKEGRKG